MKRFVAVLGMAIGLVAGAAHARTLEIIGVNQDQVWGKTTDLVWLRDWNLNGSKDYATQSQWASNLTVGTGTTGIWRMPPRQDFALFWGLALKSQYRLGVVEARAGIEPTYTALQAAA